jgi:RNA polymerase sigma-70 factor (ECF subfamily)
MAQWREPRGSLVAIDRVMEDTDLELVVALAEGDVAALRELHRRHAPWLRARLARRCSDRDLVDEAIQDTFVAVWRSAGRFDPRAEVAAWIWAIGVRRLISGLRRPANRWVTALPRSADRDEPSAEELALLGVRYGDLGRAMDRLSPELQIVVQAMVLDGLTARETAGLLGIPVGTVKTRLMRAKSRLREQLT